MSDRRFKTVFCVLVAGFLCAVCALGSAPSANADSVTYTYSGTALATCNGTYSGTCTNVTASFTLAAPLGDNLSGVDILSLITTSSISDGSGLTLSLSTLDLDEFAFVSTDSSGNITAWSIGAGVCSDPSCSTSDQLLTESGLEFGTPVGFSIDFAAIDYPKGNPCLTSSSFDPAACAALDTAYTLDNPGTWTASTPEPSSLVLLSLGLMGLVALGSRRKTARHTLKLA